MTPPKTKSKRRSIIISISVSIGVIVLGYNQIDSLNSSILLNKLLWPLIRLLGFIGIGLIVGQIIEATGWIKAMAKLAAPVFRFGHLGPHCGAVFTTAFFSGVAANAMLNEFYQDRKITRQQLFLTNFINQLPAFFLHLPTTFFIVIPLTGRAGALYFLITFLATLLRTFVFLLVGRFKLPKPVKSGQGIPAPSEESPNKWSWAQLSARIKSRLPKRITAIAIYVVPIYTAVFMLQAMGAFSQLRQIMANYVVTAFMPIEALSVVILSFAAEFTSGFAAAGAMLDAGVLTVKQTVIALLIGNIIAFPIRAIRHQLPHYMGIYAPKTGTQLLLMGQAFRITSLALIGTLYYFA